MPPLCHLCQTPDIFPSQHCIWTSWNQIWGWAGARYCHHFREKSKKRSDTRFGPLLMSSRRLVLFSGESEHFFFRRKCEQLIKKKTSKKYNGRFQRWKFIFIAQKDAPWCAWPKSTKLWITCVTPNLIPRRSYTQATQIFQQVKDWIEIVDGITLN